ncbi:fasciclin domain-containing protein [Rudanella lutea]|jgi:uncharacterized surface protein with fasciclin (FAS1) repeats|uniref:fasciclin domain-containing protein n=1 Tax=Rudanella lutea TaxID=451374 RepID=UPI0003A17C62|nr:fasciclin domain-containing protein [Rudanella lutea]
MIRTSLFRRMGFLMTVLLLGIATSCKEDEGTTPQTVTDLVVADSRFSLLEAAVLRAGLGDALRTTNNITVFAPTDEAFRAAGFADAAAINAAPVATLAAILQYHVLPTRVASSAINVGDNAPQASLLSTNGTVYVTRNSGGVSVNGARVTTADIAASNGVIHAIDKVLLPPAGNLLEAVVALNTANNNQYSLVIAAVQRAGAAVVGALSTAAGPFTLFLPNNAAFTAAGLGTEAAINAANPATLQGILLNHVVPARVFSTNLVAGAVPMAGGSASTVAINGNSVTITGKGNGTSASNVTRTDIVATNGVVHLIDRVLLP